MTENTKLVIGNKYNGRINVIPTPCVAYSDIGIYDEDNFIKITIKNLNERIIKLEKDRDFAYVRIKELESKFNSDNE